MIRISSHRRLLCAGGILVAATVLYAAHAASCRNCQNVAPAGTSMCSAKGTGSMESERSFLTENERAMSKMMAAMTAKPAGDIDEDFAAMMIPHHQGAIDMAVLELRYGRNEQLRRIAQEIIVDQQQEITAMRLALGQPLPPPVSAPTEAGDPVAHSMKDMSK